MDIELDELLESLDDDDYGFSHEEIEEDRTKPLDFNEK